MVTIPPSIADHTAALLQRELPADASQTSCSSSKNPGTTTPALRPIKLPLNDDDDTYLLKQLNELRSMQTDAPASLSPHFSVVFQWPSPAEQRKLAIHFHSMAEASTRTATLYDPTVDAETDFLSIRGMQLNLLACLTRLGPPHPLSSTSASTSTSTSISSSSHPSRLLTITLLVPPDATTDCRKYIISSFERMRKQIKAELIAAKKAEIMKVKGSLGIKTHPSSAPTQVNDENESPNNNNTNNDSTQPPTRDKVSQV